MTNFEKIIISLVSLLIITVLVFGVIIFRQQKTINALSGSAAGTSNQSAVQSSAKKNSPPLTEVIKQFGGAIENISANQLTINVKLPDFSKSKDPNKLKNANEPVNLVADDFETLAKKITVDISVKTVFEKKSLAELKVGDKIFVISDKSPYVSDTVTAEKITYIELPK